MAGKGGRKSTTFTKGDGRGGRKKAQPVSARALCQKETIASLRALVKLRDNPRTPAAIIHSCCLSILAYGHGKPASEASVVGVGDARLPSNKAHVRIHRNLAEAQAAAALLPEDEVVAFIPANGFEGRFDG